MLAFLLGLAIGFCASCGIALRLAAHIVVSNRMAITTGDPVVAEILERAGIDHEKT